MAKEFQAKHIADFTIVNIVDRAEVGCNGATRGRIHELFPDTIPSKVVDAKLRAAVLKGILTGCASDVCARRSRCVNPDNCDKKVYRVAEGVEIGRGVTGRE